MPATAGNVCLPLLAMCDGHAHLLILLTSLARPASLVLMQTRKGGAATILGAHACATCCGLTLMTSWAGASCRVVQVTHTTHGPGHLGACQQRQRPQVHHPCAPGGEAEAAASGWMGGQDWQLSCIQQVGMAAAAGCRLCTSSPGHTFSTAPSTFTWAARSCTQHNADHDALDSLTQPVRINQAMLTVFLCLLLPLLLHSLCLRVLMAA